MEKIVVDLADVIVAFAPQQNGEMLASVAEKDGKFSALVKGTPEQWEALTRSLKAAQGRS